MSILDNNLKVLELRSGLVVANFSSGHSFTFTTGEVLPACSIERCQNLALIASETETRVSTAKVGVGYTDIELSFMMSEAIIKEILRVMLVHDEVDIFIVPLPQLLAMKAYGQGAYWNSGAKAFEFSSVVNDGSYTTEPWSRRFRTIRKVKRTGLEIFPDRFCK